jgi:hypothetical protein
MCRSENGTERSGGARRVQSETRLTTIAERERGSGERALRIRQRSGRKEPARTR